MNRHLTFPPPHTLRVHSYASRRRSGGGTRRASGKHAFYHNKRTLAHISYTYYLCCVCVCVRVALHAVEIYNVDARKIFQPLPPPPLLTHAFLKVTEALLTLVLFWYHRDLDAFHIFSRRAKLLRPSAAHVYVAHAYFYISKFWLFTYTSIIHTASFIVSGAYK